MILLITGGAGYIGTHTCIQLLAEGHRLVVVDNLSNGSRSALRQVEMLSGKSIIFYQVDLRDQAGLDAVFDRHEFDAVIHFAGLKAVGESSTVPLAYYDNNMVGTISLLKSMQRAAVWRFVFSSSATVYGMPSRVPLDESCPVSTINPYGRTKLFVEEILADLAAAEARWQVAVLRYFNPIGAHPSGCIGEAPQGVPNNLVPYISQVAIGKRPFLQVFGDDYPTPDGTGVRDYIHVVDLANGHLKALENMRENFGVSIYNLGTGQGYSVLEMVKAFERVSGRQVPYRVVARRPGDVAVCYADPRKAFVDLGWKAELGLEQMIADTWRWQMLRPDGYDAIPSLS